ncbi:MAG: hypothetical protein R2780_08120 [Crocinitomicaceae bacterium]
MKTLSILGCGWLGKIIALELKQLNIQVKCSTKSSKLNLDTVEHHFIDINTVQDLPDSFLNSEMLIISASFKSIKAHEKLIKSITHKGNFELVILMSSTFVYENNFAIINENLLVNNKQSSCIEQCYLNSGIKNLYVFRLGGLVGPERHPGNFFRPQHNFKNNKDRINLVHANMISQCVISVMNKTIPAGVYNIVADEHPLKHEFYAHAHFDLHGSHANFTVNENQNSNPIKVVSNAKIKRHSGLNFSLSNYYNFIGQITDK